MGGHLRVSEPIFANHTGLSAALRLLTAATKESPSTTEQLREQVLRVHTSAHASSTFQTSFSHLVVHGPLVRVGEDFISVCQVLEQLRVAAL